MSLTRSSSSSIRAGGEIRLVCLTVVNTTYINTPVRGLINWYHHGNKTIKPTSRIRITTNPLQSVITFTPVLMKDEGTIRCVVSLEPVGADNQKRFILLSEEGTASYNLTIEGNKLCAATMNTIAHLVPYNCMPIK